MTFMKVTDDGNNVHVRFTLDQRNLDGISIDVTLTTAAIARRSGADVLDLLANSANRFLVDFQKQDAGGAK